MTRLSNDCFALPQGVYWTPVDDALAVLRGRLGPIAPVETVTLDVAAGRVLAMDAVAARPHPAVDNAAVDGYAFAHRAGALDPERSSEVPQVVNLRLRQGRAAPGAPWRERLGAGEAVRILTGAAMPEGADTVALQEDVEIGAGRIRFPLPKRPGANRRRAGENLKIGDVALAAGARLTPQALAQLAAAGLGRVATYRPLRVALLSTGDELTPPGGADDPAQVIDSNRPMLAALLREAGCDIVDIGIIRDQRQAVEAALDRAAEADVIVTSGGASSGDEDHIAKVLADTAGRDNSDAFHLWRIAMKPGRPMAMGLRRGAPVFGLPGNPVAAFVCFLVFVRPAIGLLSGAGWRAPRGMRLPLGFDFPKKPGRREYLRVRIGPDGRLEKYRSEGSGLIEGLVWADGLTDLTHDAGPLSAGDLATFLPFSEYGILK